MKKLLLGLCCLPFFAAAQNFYFSTRLGFAGYHGDLKAGLNPFSQIKLLGSVGAQYDLTEHIAARSYFTLTSLKADDKKGTPAMQQRNLNFQTKVFDWELTGQYSFFSLNDRWWTPYVFTGIGFFHFNPYTKDAGGQKIYLHPLTTEGQGFVPGVSPYKLTQISIPFGIGANYSLGEDTRIGFEAGYRKLFTDYLDDVSTAYADESSLRKASGQQAVDMAWRGAGPYPVAGTPRGSPKYKDGYYYMAITFTIRYWFDKYKQIAGIPSGHKDKKVGCPASRGF